MKRLEHYWQDRNAVAWALLPLSWLYCLVVILRRAAYRPFVAILQDGHRISANHLVCLGMVLERRAQWSGVAAEKAMRGEGDALTGCLPALPASIASTLFRTDALRQVGGVDAEDGEVAAPEFWARLGTAGDVGTLAMPVASVPSRPQL